MNLALSRSRLTRMLIALLGVWVVLAPLRVQAASTGIAARCARTRNDDTVIPYDPSLRAGIIKAYSRLFPSARLPPAEAELTVGTKIRCTQGRLLVCFVGANLPCGKMNLARNNPGADGYCRARPDVDVVPAFTTGHETIFSYRCAAGRWIIVGRTIALDARGFAARLWAPID